MSNLRKIGLASALLAGSVVAAQAAFIKNGSFESTGVASGFTQVNAGDSTSITDWTVTSVGDGVGLDYVSSAYWQAADGLASLDMNGGGQAAIEQSVTGLTAGESYTIRFFMSGNPDSATAPNPKLMDVSAGGTTTQFSYDITAGPNTRTDMMWQAKYFTFTAASASETLKFASAVSGNWGPALDNVSFVPLPAAGFLLLGALGGLGFVSRKRKAA